MSKGVMMGAALTFSVVHHQNAICKFIALCLFCLTTVMYIVMSLNSTTFLLYMSTAILIPPVLAVVVISQPQYVLAPVVAYVPVVIAFILYIIEDCSRWHAEGLRLLPGWATSHDLSLDSEWKKKEYGSNLTVGELTYLSSSQNLSLGSSVCSRVWGKASILPSQAQAQAQAHENLVTKFMWSPSQSCASNLSSRSSDISMPSRLESLPSSWGTLTRAWFPEFLAREADSLS
ncbi:hypothetical protein GGS20DRAFT_588093 [Poronia punctata]|nr:hypothetical protein GGS20DRAFT_588093 [Poronia punctata]